MTHQVYLPDDVWGEVKEFLIPPKKPDTIHPLAQLMHRDVIDWVDMDYNMDSFLHILEGAPTLTSEKTARIYLAKYGLEHIMRFCKDPPHWYPSNN